MPKPGSSKARDSPELREAIREAKEVSEKMGAASIEAILAWETVEEIASASNSPALGGMLDDECLVETIEACEAMEELQRALFVSEQTDRYSG